jgi:hypothetical protein
MNIKKMLVAGWLGGGGSSVPTTSDVQTRFGADLVLSLDTSLLGMMWKESATGVAISPVSADADLVGLIQDVSPNAYYINATGDTLRPALGSDGTVASFLTCDGTSDVLVVANSRTGFRNMVGTTPAFSIMLKFKKGSSTDGVIQMLMSCRGGTSGRTGFDVGISTGNKLTFTLSTLGAPNITMTTKTTTANYLEADGWISVVIDVSGAGGSNQLSIYKNDGSAETANVIVGYDIDFTDLITFFKNSNDTSSRFKGNFAQCIILKRVSTAADRTWFQTFNPARTTTLKPVNKESEYDFSDTSTLFQDTGAATPATANNDLVRLVRSTVVSNMGGTLNRNATAPSDAKRPVLKTNIQNALSGVQFDGDITFQELFFANRWYSGGCWTFYFVLRNRDVIEGTKFLSDGASGVTSGTNYMTQTAEDDGSNTPSLPGFGTVDGDPYLITHPGGAAHGIKSTGRNDTVNAYCIKVDGANITVFNSALTRLTFTSTGSYNFTKLGGIAGTWTQGDWYQMTRYSGIHSDAVALTTLSALITKWGAQPT